jgi:uncharacterized tellurite resistance protein B-like protein
MRNLIALASIDGSLDMEERNLIQTIGQRRGLKEWQIAELIEETETHQFFVPDTVGNRMNLLFDVMQIVYADGKVTENEISFVCNIINALKLEAEIVQDLMALFETRTPSSSEWNDFIETVVEIESRKFVTIL